MGSTSKKKEARLFMGVTAVRVCVCVCVGGGGYRDGTVRGGGHRKTLGENIHKMTTAKVSVSKRGPVDK